VNITVSLISEIFYIKLFLKYFFMAPDYIV